VTFSLDSSSRRALGYKLIDHIDEYFSSLPDRPVQLPADQRTWAPLRDRMPDLPHDAAAVLDEVCRDLVDNGFHVPSANYFGLMNPTPTYMAVLAEALVAALNPQLATLARSQLASKIEHETVRWIGERIWPSTPAPSGDSASSDIAHPAVEFNGTFTSGGNEANFTALAMALAAQFPESVENGVASIGAQPVLYASAEGHHSLDKSAGLLGLGRRALRRIAVNDRVQLDVDKLDSAISRDHAAGYRPFCVVATAGTTNSGAIDDIVALADLCRRHNLWLHVDGAYGAAAVFSDTHRDLVRGIERADSVTIDPHKWLAMPFAAGVVLTSRATALRDAFEVTTPYMPRTSAPAALIDNFKISIQWSRRMNSLKLWLTLEIHGRIAYEQHIDRQLQLARIFADWVRSSADFELAAPQVLPIVNFRVKQPGAAEAEIAAANNAIVEAVTQDGQRWISSTLVAGRSVMRMMVISYLTEQRHLDALAAALTSAARSLHAGATAAR
jgi:glutamate/tyrosine decarboxylase-like PLP-dependent enzyme